MTKPKVAFITGITGQDGAILAELLLSKGYDMHGLHDYMHVCDTERIDHLDSITLHTGNITDSGNLHRILQSIQPDEIYNMAAMTHVGASFEMPAQTLTVNAMGTENLLSATRALHAQKDVRFYQASSSEMFGKSPAPQNEDTAFQPCSPYGRAKLYAYWAVRNYRDAYGMFASNGILFNHESTLRGEEFVSRKITKSVCEIEAGFKDKLSLGNLSAKRDWGHARDYMEGIYAIMHHDRPDDFVLATGQTCSVREFVEKAFAKIGITISWRGQGLEEQGIDKMTGRVLVDIDPALFRPQEVTHLQGDASKAKHVLGWEPKISLDMLIAEMMDADRLVSHRAYGT